MIDHYSRNISKRRKGALKQFESYCKLLGAQKRMVVIAKIAIDGRCSVRDMLLDPHGNELFSRPTFLRHLDRMVEEQILIRERGKPGAKGYYSLNTDNEPLMRMTSGFRKEERRPEEETLRMVEAIMKEKKEKGCKRAELYEALKGDLSQARLSQTIKQLIETNRIERIEGKKPSYRIRS